LDRTSLLEDTLAKPDEDDGSVKVIAFYLPQYHPIKENDEWWGPGFTEWRNVTRARPNFVGHYQPHHPADLGYYDLRLPETRRQQADLARQYGIHGFCYHHYWFSGRRVLERPFNEVLASGAPDFPFCLCWANENWTRTWIDTDNDVLLAQHYHPEDAEKFIRDLLPAFRDRRYITVDQKPLLLVYRVDLIPDIQRVADLWRQICEKEGLKGLYLAAVQFLGIDDPRPYNFDAAVEFPPHHYINDDTLPSYPITYTNPDCRGWASDYEKVVRQALNRRIPDYVLFRGAMPSWDNTARRQNTSHFFINASPAAFGYWMKELVQSARNVHPVARRLVFVNAWNEWGEGCHLEPDLRHGHAFLEELNRALSNTANLDRFRASIDLNSLSMILSSEDLPEMFRRQQRTIERLTDEVRRLRRALLKPIAEDAAE
jgi:lipopolysaccharide biosynthesis protein